MLAPCSRSSIFARGIAYCASLAFASSFSLSSRPDLIQGGLPGSNKVAWLDHFVGHDARHSTLRFHSNATPILVIGDVHGCFDEMIELYEKAGRPDVVILVGDLVNKGPKSPQVVCHVRTSPGWFAVRGNHDNGALKQIHDGGSSSSRSKKYDWLFQKDGECVLSTEDVQWLSRLPYTIRIPAQSDSDDDVIVVHAGLVPGIPIEDQTESTMVTIRTVIETKEKKHEYDYSGDGKPWASVWKGPEFVIFGHDARRGIQDEQHALGLDSGACYGKKLTGVLLPSRRMYQVVAKKTYCPITND